MESESGSGTVLAITLLAFLAAVFLAVVSIGGVRQTQTRLQAATDLAAIAASQTYRGMNTGLPCERAGQILTLNMVKLAGCSIVGDEATVAANLTLMGIVLNATATAVGD
ncbi:MAG: flp pilus-assembly TadE/G-like family protein [Actinomycetales bacterium]|nr:flp pilus-assembly TadE/G-like family protein [Actinomycetales bacterium]